MSMWHDVDTLPHRMTPRLHRSRLSWLVAFLATLLNAVAPVLAYAEGPPLHGHEREAPALVLAHDVHHHPAGHVHAGGDEHHQAPTTPHCPYCLDFAAGAPLAPAPLVIAAPPRIAAPIVVQARATPIARASLRLASPRAPPRGASA
jgi:hypothetical protein